MIADNKRPLKGIDLILEREEDFIQFSEFVSRMPFLFFRQLNSVSRFAEEIVSIGRKINTNKESLDCLKIWGYELLFETIMDGQGVRTIADRLYFDSDSLVPDKESLVAKLDRPRDIYDCYERVVHTSDIFYPSDSIETSLNTSNTSLIIVDSYLREVDNKIPKNVRDYWNAYWHDVGKPFSMFLMELGGNNNLCGNS